MPTREELEACEWIYDQLMDDAIGQIEEKASPETKEKFDGLTRDQKERVVCRMIDKGDFQWKIEA